MESLTYFEKSSQPTEFEWEHFMESLKDDPEYLIAKQIPKIIKCTKCNRLYPNAKQRSVSEALSYECYLHKNVEWDSAPQKEYYVGLSQKIQH
jgi:hypothetical protein